MPKQFSKFGLSFQYPDNWVLDEEDLLAGRQSVTVGHPEDGAFWTVALYSPDTEPKDLAQAVVDSLREEYPREELEVEPIERVFEDRSFVGQEIHFQHLDLVCRAAILACATDQATLTVFYQGEDSDFQASTLLFEAMTTSLARSLGDLRFEWDEAPEEPA